MYVDNMIYNYGKWKNVFTKGNKGYTSVDQCPGVYIAPKRNSIQFVINGTKGINKLVLDDFPIKKWFCIGIVARDRECDIYMDGKLYYTKTLNGTLKTNNGNLFMLQEGGYGGKFSSLSYFPSAKSSRFINNEYRKGPFKINIIRKLWRNITGETHRFLHDLGVSVNVDIDIDVPFYNKHPSTICKGQMIQKLGKISLEKAKNICEKNTKCECISQTTKNFKNITKDNFELWNKKETETKDGYNAYTKFHISNLHLPKTLDELDNSVTSNIDNVKDMTKNVINKTDIKATNYLDEAYNDV